LLPRRSLTLSVRAHHTSRLIHHIFYHSYTSDVTSKLNLPHSIIFNTIILILTIYVGARRQQALLSRRMARESREAAAALRGRWCECSCDVHLGSLHYTRANLTINMHLHFYSRAERSGCATTATKSGCKGGKNDGEMGHSHWYVKMERTGTELIANHFRPRVNESCYSIL
jgi:hypothetical protein